MIVAAVLAAIVACASITAAAAAAVSHIEQFLASSMHVSNANEMYTTAANYASTAMTLVCMHLLLQVLTVYWQFILPKHASGRLYVGHLKSYEFLVMATAASNEKPVVGRANPLLDPIERCVQLRWPRMLVVHGAH
eukprot:4739-Heterococcus_DN1.PRE.2